MALNWLQQRWFQVVNLVRGNRKKRSGRARGPSRYTPRLLEVERLEDRLTPANYAWSGNGTALLLQLDTNESLSIANPTANTTTFTLSGTGTDTWTQTGSAPASGGGNGTATITFNVAGDLAASITINNSIAQAGTNNVTFASGTISSGSISADTTQGTGTTGDIVVNTALVQATSGTVNLTTSGAISDAATGTIQAVNLALSAATGVGTSANPLLTQVSILGAQTLTSGGVFLSNTGALTIGTVTPISGITTQGGAISVHLTTAGAGLTVADPILSSGGNISLQADGMSLLAAVNAGAGSVQLDSNTGTRPIDLGGSPALPKFAAVNDNAPALDVWTLNNDTGALLTGLGTTNQQTLSTVPANGDQNPYGLAYVPLSFPTTGTLQPGDVLVGNFNNSVANGNTQGLGTTVVRLIPAGQLSTFFTSSAPGISNALAVLKAGFVIVGNVPNAGSGAVGPGSLQVLDSNGNVVNVPGLNGPLITDPWDLTVNDLGNTAQVYVSNVSGTAGANGTVVRIDLSITGGVITVVDEVKIGSLYPTRPDAAAFVVGPGGLAFDPASHTLYVASQDDLVNGTETGTIFSILNADTIQAANGEGNVVFADPTHLHGPMGLLLAPNGDLIVANSDAVNANPSQPSELVEFTPAGQFVTQFSVDPANGGAFNVSLFDVPTPNLFLGQNDLNEVTAGVLQIGSTSDTGGITIAGPIAAASASPGTWNTLDLENGGGITQTTGSTITTANLELKGTGSFTLPEANAVGVLAAAVTGPLSFNDVSPLTVGTVNSTQGITGSGAVTVTDTGALTITGGITLTGTGALNLTATSLTASGPAIDQGGGTFTATVSAPSSIAAPITGVGGNLVKAGSGLLTLTGTDTFTGTTTVSAGTLDVNGTLSTGGGTVTVNNGSTLGGTGTIQRSVSVSGTLAPGVAGPGVLTTNGLTFMAGSTLAVPLTGSAAGTGYSQLVVNGPVSLGNATLQLSGGFSPTPGTVVTLISNLGNQPVTPGFQGQADGSSVTIGSFTGLLSYEGNTGKDVTLTVTGPVNITGAAGNNNFVLQKSGTNLQLLDHGAVLDSRPLASVTDYNVTASVNTTNNLTIDLTTGGYFAVAGAIFFIGGAGGNNNLVVTGGNFIATTLNYTGANAGTVSGQPTTGAVMNVGYTTTDFLGLDGNTNTFMGIQLPGTGNQVSLTDEGDQQISGLASNNGTFVPTTFEDPTTLFQLNTGAGNDAINLDRVSLTTANYVIDGGAGHNFLGVTLGSQGGVNIPAGDVDVLTPTSIHSNNFNSSQNGITYQATGGDFGQGLILNLPGGGNQVFLTGTQAGAPTLVNTGKGNDNIVVSSAAGSTGTLSDLASVLEVDAGVGANQLTVNDAGRATADTYYVTNDAISANGEGIPIFYQATGGTFSAINLVASAKPGDFLIVMSQLAGAPTLLFGNTTGSTFYVDVTSTSAYSGLAVTGGSAMNILGVFDTSGGGQLHNPLPGTGTGKVVVDYTNGSTSTINYTGVQEVNVPPGT